MTLYVCVDRKECVGRLAVSKTSPRSTASVPIPLAAVDLLDTAQGTIAHNQQNKHFPSKASKRGVEWSGAKEKAKASRPGDFAGRNAQGHADRKNGCTAERARGLLWGARRKRRRAPRGAGNAESGSLPGEARPNLKAATLCRAMPARRPSGQAYLELLLQKQRDSGAATLLAAGQGGQASIPRAHNHGHCSANASHRIAAKHGQSTAVLLIAKIARHFPAFPQLCRSQYPHFCTPKWRTRTVYR